MKIYVAGKITGLDNYKEVFEEAGRMLEEEGHTVMLPSILPEGFEYEEYMKICFAMIDVCDSVYMLSNWDESPGAVREQSYAINSGKSVRMDIDIEDLIRRG